MGRTIRGARLCLSLHRLSSSENVPEASLLEPFGTIISASASFPMNDIPSMEIEVPLGKRLGTDGMLYQNLTYNDDLKEAIRTRKPLGVRLSVEKIGDEKLLGLEEGGLCLFKGYVSGVSEDHGINGGSMRLSMTHWLSDLAIFPILHRMSSPENAVDVSTDGVFNERSGGNDNDRNSSNMNGTAWTPARAYNKAMKNPHNNLLEVLKVGFQTALNEGLQLKETDAGYVNQELFYLVSNSLKAIGSENLEFSSDLELSRLLRHCIAMALEKENRDAYFSVTLWQKLIQTMLPQFYASLIPLVEKGIVVPQPGIHMDPSKAIEIEKNMILSLRTRTAYGKTLGGVVLASRPNPSGPFGTAVSQIRDSKYPTEPKPGVIKTCYLPPWLEAFSQACGYRIKTITKNGLAHKDAETKAKAEQDEKKKTVKENKSVYEKFADAFTRSVYFAEATKGNGATLTTVLNLDACPGTVVKVPIPDDVTVKGTEYCYGTVHTVQYHISPDQAISTFVLSNVRNQEQMDSMTTTGALLYESGWYNQEQKLYVKEF